MPLQRITYPDIIGIRYSFRSIEMNSNGLVFAGFKSINYSNMLEPQDVWGTAPQKIGRTRGKQNAEASAEVYKEEWENYRLSLGGGIGYMEIPHNITCSYSEIGQIPITDLLVGCRITKAENGHSEGDDALTVKLTFNVMRLEEGGAGIPTLPIPML